MYINMIPQAVKTSMSQAVPNPYINQYFKYGHKTV